MTVPTAELGAGGPPASRVGLTLMGMPGAYGPADLAQRAALEAAVPPAEVAGDRYDAGSTAALDSERDARGS